VKRPLALSLALAAAALGVVALQAFRAWRLAFEDFRPRPLAFVAPEALDGLQALKLRTKSGLQVGASFVPPKNGLAVIVAHGAQESRLQMWPDVATLARAGFGVLAFDWPGHGESEGSITLAGNAEHEAFTAAVDFLAARDDVKRIGAYGFSNGGGLLTQFTEDEPRVVTLLAAAAWTDSLEQTRYKFRRWSVVRQWPALHVYRQLMGANVRPIDGAEKLRGRRTLFVTCEDDPVVPSTMSHELAETAQGELRVWPGSGHGAFRECAGAKVWPEQLTGFFSKSLPAP
jgi:pimeloyl-ACP methyl ester carboxylesterase